MAKPRRRNSSKRANQPAASKTQPARVLPEPQFPQISVGVGITKLHQGPIPAAEDLAEYERVMPGLGERIIRMAEKPLEMAYEQQTHRITLEKQVVKSDINRSWAGLIIGAAIAVGVVTAGIVFTVQGRTTIGLAAILTPLAGLASIFVYTDQRKRQERREAWERTVGS